MIRFTIFVFILINFCHGDVWNGYDPSEIFKDSEKTLEPLESISTQCLKDFKFFSKDISSGKEWTNKSIFSKTC